MPEYTSRPCGGTDDLAQIFEFCRANIAARLPGRSLWHPGEIAWQLTAVEGRALAANVRLWSDAEGVAGVAIFEPPLNVTFDIRAGIEDGDALAVGILEWAERRRRKLLERQGEDVPIAYAMLGKGTLAATAVESDAERIATLTRLGYRPAERGNVRYQRDLSLPIPETVLPAGMRLRHVTDADLDERIDLHRDAWSVWGNSTANVPAYRLLRASPVYDETLDIVVEERGRALRELLHLLVGRAERHGHVRAGGLEARVHRPRPRARGDPRRVAAAARARHAHGARGHRERERTRAAALPGVRVETVDEERYYVKELA